ncbi:MAG TPA: hypothetical protein PKY12_06920, partial [Catalimonadaceae bacterium]|nr:hypothetical protein [Catalimonadaceae bacterium]
DFGKALNSGAYLKSLRRTRSGPFSVEDAQTVGNWLDEWTMSGQMHP